MYDAIIIGAGPAGCVAAIVLARAQQRVCLIEQHRFPRDKVCGECLSSLGYETLERLELSSSFQQLTPVRLSRSVIHAPHGRSLEVDLPTAMWGVSRRRFDAWLLDHARESGAEILQPARCEQIQPCVVVRDLNSNRMRELDAKWILLAEGKRSLTKKKPLATGDLGIKAHFTGIAGPRDAIELFGVSGHYGGIAPIEDGTWNIAFSIPRKRVQAFGGDLDALFADVVLENRSLAQRLSGAQRCSGWLASPLPRFAISRRWQQGIIPLGNAACSIEPIGGEGMGLAMRSAELAANALTSSNPDIPALRHSFERLWRKRRLSCRAAAIVASSPVALDRATRFVPRPIARMAMQLIGK